MSEKYVIKEEKILVAKKEKGKWNVGSIKIMYPIIFSAILSFVLVGIEFGDFILDFYGFDPFMLLGILSALVSQFVFFIMMFYAILLLIQDLKKGGLENSSLKPLDAIGIVLQSITLILLILSIFIYYLSPTTVLVAVVLICIGLYQYKEKPSKLAISFILFGIATIIILNVSPYILPMEFGPLTPESTTWY